MRARTLAVLACLALAGGAGAQSLPDLFQQGCTELGAIAGFEWICTAGDLLARVTDLVTSLHEEFAAFGRDLSGAWLEDALATLAEQAGLNELNAHFAALDQALAEGPSAFRDAVSAVLASVRLSNLADRDAPGVLLERLTDPDTPLRDYATLYDLAAQTSPNLAAADGMLASRENALVTARAEAAAVQEMNTRLAASVADASPVQDAAARVLTPSIGGLGGGDASTLEDYARTAVSSRAAIQVLTEGLADLMRQQATFSTDLSASLRVLAQQQVLTTWELQLAVNALTEGLQAELQAQRADLEAQLAREYDAGVELAESLRRVASGTAGVIAPDLDALAFDTLGW